MKTSQEDTRDTGSAFREKVRSVIASFLLVMLALFIFAGGMGAQNGNAIQALQQLLQKYKGCILERYETQQDMVNRGLPGNLSGLTNTNGLQARDVVTCAAGNPCSLAMRASMFAVLQAQANRGDTTNFEANLERIIPQDCFLCAKHQEWHTKHVHCTMECGGNNGFTQGPCFEGCKAGVDVNQLVTVVVNDIHGVFAGLAQALSNPTIQYADARGYKYDETSEPWKQMCTAFPCFDALQWPGYASYSFNDTINGQPVVIQLWKGTCQKFLGMNQFPGGIGAEVGVYHRVPGRARPATLPFLPPPLADVFLKPITNIPDNQLWWAYPELNTQVSFKLVNPITNQVYFETTTEKTYWLNKWMSSDSYAKYVKDQGLGKTPKSPLQYKLIFTINGKTYSPW
jgi:hypothetical protein